MGEWVYECMGMGLHLHEGEWVLSEDRLQQLQPQRQLQLQCVGQPRRRVSVGQETEVLRQRNSRQREEERESTGEHT